MDSSSSLCSVIYISTHWNSFAIYSFTGTACQDLLEGLDSLVVYRLHSTVDCHRQTASASSHKNYFQSILGSVSYCVVILRTPPYWSVTKTLFTWSGGPRSSGVGFFCFHALADTKQKKPAPLERGPPLHVNRVLEWRRVILTWWVIHFTADHAQQAIWCANLILLSLKSQKIYTWNKSSWRRAKRSWLVGVRRRKRFRLSEKCLLRSSLHQYINNQHPIAQNDNCLFRRHPHTPASCDTVVWIQPWTRNEK